MAAGATDDWRDRCDRLGLSPYCYENAGLAVARDKTFGERDHRDHALISFVRALAESDDPVFAEDQAVARLRLFEDLDRLFGEPEARHQIRHESQAAAKRVGALFLSVWLVDDAEHGAGMRVVDEFMWQESMQHHFDGRIGCGRIDQIGAFDREEFFIRDRLVGAQIPQWRQANRRQAFRFDRGHVGARSLDPQDLDFVAEQVTGTRLQRSVAAAMQHQFRIGTEQSCAVDTKRQIARDAGLGAARHDFRGFSFDPSAFHGRAFQKRTAPDLVRGSQELCDKIMFDRATARPLSTAGEAS